MRDTIACLFFLYRKTRTVRVFGRNDGQSVLCRTEQDQPLYPSRAVRPLAGRGESFYPPVQVRDEELAGSSFTYLFRVVRFIMRKVMEFTMVFHKYESEQQKDVEIAAMSLIFTGRNESVPRGTFKQRCGRGLHHLDLRVQRLRCALVQFDD